MGPVIATFAWIVLLGVCWPLGVLVAVLWIGIYAIQANLSQRHAAANAAGAASLPLPRRAGGSINVGTGGNPPHGWGCGCIDCLDWKHRN